MIGEKERGLLARVSRTGRVEFTSFLDPAAAKELRGLARSMGVYACENGGCDDAERVMCALSPEDFPLDDWPLLSLDILWDKLGGELAHRDFLGALLGLGIKREFVGDIRVDAPNCRAWVCMGESVGSFALLNLTEVGRVRVSVREAQGGPPQRERGEVRTVNVQSLRLDSVLASAMHLSRARAQEIIRAGRVQLNWAECLRTDAHVQEGDTLSIRGAGRIKILPTEGVSRKGRLFLSIESFMHNR